MSPSRPQRAATKRSYVDTDGGRSVRTKGQSRSCCSQVLKYLPKIHRVGTSSRKRKSLRTTSSSRSSTSTTLPTKRRGNRGILEKITDIPVDVLYEVGYHLSWLVRRADLKKLHIDIPQPWASRPSSSQPDIQGPPRPAIEQALHIRMADVTQRHQRPSSNAEGSQ